MNRSESLAKLHALADFARRDPAWYASHAFPYVSHGAFEDRAFCVVYRTGGTENFVWHRTIAFETREDAVKTLRELEAAGYPGHIERFGPSLRIGLPETFA